VGTDNRISELVDILGPEDLPERYLSQESVEKYARELHTILSRLDALKPKLEQAGAGLSGRTLLIGPPGCDFESFVYYLVREIPLNLIRIRMKNIKREIFAEQLIEAIEFAKRNAPSVLYLPNFDSLTQSGSFESRIIEEEIRNVGWATDEVIIVASTTSPEKIDREVVSQMERTYQLVGSTLEDRIRVLEQVLQDRSDMDPATIAELTGEWSFSDIKRLAVNLLFYSSEETTQMTRDQLEKVIEESRVLPVGSENSFQSYIALSKQDDSQRITKIDAEYPDDFLDQLYLMAVGEDYQETQRVIETLNSNLPLTEKNRQFLSRHPYILTGSSEERLTRLLRAKRASDRLRRVLGRQS